MLLTYYIISVYCIVSRDSVCLVLFAIIIFQSAELPCSVVPTRYNAYSQYMTYQRNVLRRYKEFTNPELVGLGDGRTVKALGTGDVKFISTLPQNKIIGWMKNVLYVPDLTSNLFSVRATANQGNVVSFGRKCWIKNSRKRLVGTGSAAGKLYKLNCKVLKSLKEEANVAGEKEASEKMDLWHRRLAHVNTGQLRQLASQAEGIDIPLKGKPSFCEACVEGKMHRLPHPPLKSIECEQETP